MRGKKREEMRRGETRKAVVRRGGQGRVGERRRGEERGGEGRGGEEKGGRVVEKHWERERTEKVGIRCEMCDLCGLYAPIQE